MELLDSRRLTGANCISDCPGAVIDIGATDDTLAAIISTWSETAKALLDAVGWDKEKCYVRRCEGGASLAISAPIDALYAATDINECAWNLATGFLSNRQGVPRDRSWVTPHLARLEDLIADERCPALTDIQAAADKHDVTFLYDDDEVSVGTGTRTILWDVGSIPSPEQVDWDSSGDIPVGLITGTNGKTTSVRMAAAIGCAAGLTTGYSTTDSISINQEIVDKGDYAGPEGARTVLRNKRVELAILETARGGLLRRGVNTPRATAALLTRIARDHIGDFGSRNLEELLDIKWVVTRALDRHGRLVLNADDERLVARSGQSPAPVVFFSLDSSNPVISKHIAAGGEAWAFDKGHIARWQDDHWQSLIDVKEIPLTLDGAARHNIANALGVAALTSALGIDDEAICRGLCTLEAQSNPGRGNLFEIDGVKVLVDFAHNPDAFRAIVEMSRAVPAKRRLIAFGEAGDRTDELILDLARIAWQLPPDRIMTLEIARHARGREPGEIADLLKHEFNRLGARPGQLSHHHSELGALKKALDWAEAGDMIILLSLAERDEILSFLSR